MLAYICVHNNDSTFSARINKPVISDRMVSYFLFFEMCVKLVRSRPSFVFCNNKVNISKNSVNPYHKIYKNVV